jgi:hypothetical protein
MQFSPSTSERVAPGQAARFPFAVHSPDEECDFFYPLAPGVRGWAVERDGEIFIEQLKAEVEGNGDVGRFLDSLPENCVIWNVVSDRLEGMLRRRGWRPQVPRGKIIELWQRS